MSRTTSPTDGHSCCFCGANSTAGNPPGPPPPPPSPGVRCQWGDRMRGWIPGCLACGGDRAAGRGARAATQGGHFGEKLGHGGHHPVPIPPPPDPADLPSPPNPGIPAVFSSGPRLGRDKGSWDWATGLAQPTHSPMDRLHYPPPPRALAVGTHLFCLAQPHLPHLSRCLRPPPGNGKGAESPQNCPGEAGWGRGRSRC